MGRPKIPDAIQEHRKALCIKWAAEVKRKSGLSAKELAWELNYGARSTNADGRAWRLLASGMKTPSPETFQKMNAEARKRGWLEPFGAIRYANYDSPRDNDEEPIEAADDEARWRSSTLSRVLVMLLAHARTSGVDQARFFKEAHETLNHMEKGWCDRGGEVEGRARRVAETAVRDLLDGPEYPTTSLLLQ